MHRDSATQFGWVAQLAEQRTENPRVGGSIPPPATPMRKPEVQQILQQDRLPGFINFSRDRIEKGGLMTPVNACRASARQALRACQRVIFDRHRLSPSIWAAACFGLIVGSRRTWRSVGLCLHDEQKSQSSPRKADSDCGYRWRRSIKVSVARRFLELLLIRRNSLSMKKRLSDI